MPSRCIQNVECLMTKSPLRVGMIGAGWVTAYHLPAWQRQAHRAQVVAIADPGLEAAKARAGAFGVPQVFASAEAMLDSVDLDIVDICAPREAHVGLVKLAASPGRAIICQKPLAPTFPEAESLLAGLPPSQRLMVHENWRFRDYYRRIKQWLGEGAAGELRQVNFEFLSSGMIPDTSGERPALERQPFFRTQHRLLVMEVLIHHLDTLRFLLGDLEVVSARLERSNNGIVAEDVAAITLRCLSDGLPVFVTGNLAVHGAPPAPRDHLRLFGSKGTIELQGNALSLAGPRPQAVTFDAEATYQGSYDAVIAHFLDGLESGAPFETAPADNMKTLELVETIYAISGFDPHAEPKPW
jgi:D-apiose dehydrogenase